MRKRTVTALVMSLVLSCVFLSCTRQFRTPISVPPITSPITPSSEKMVLTFEEFFPGKPLSETVWGSLRGPSWSPVESNEVGVFVRREGAFVPNIFERPFDQLTLPFGRTLSALLESAALQSFPGSRACFNEGCLHSARSEAGPRYIATIKVINYRVWEGSIGVLDFYAKLDITLTDTKRDTSNQRELTKYLLGQLAARPFLDPNGRLVRVFSPWNVQTVSNKFASELALETLGYLKEWIEGPSSAPAAK